jgi:hypothetical protein
MFKEIMNDLWLARISSLSYEVGLYVVLLEVLHWKHNFKIIMNAVEDYARRWIKREVDQDPELESLSDWISSLSNEVGLYVVLLEVLLFMPNSLIRHSK